MVYFAVQRQNSASTHFWLNYAQILLLGYYITIQKFDVSKVFFKEVLKIAHLNFFFQQGCIKFIQNDSKDIIL